MMVDELQEQLIAASSAPLPVAGAHVEEAALLAFREDRLTDAEADEVAEHLCGCAPCRAMLAGLAAPVEGVALERAEAALVTTPEVSSTEAPPARGAAEVRRLPRPAALLIGAGGVLAAAAAALLSIGPPASALPPYTLEGPSGFVRSHRGAAATEASILLPQGTLRLELLPSEPIAPAPAAAVFVETRGRLHRARADIEARQGAFAVEVSGRDLFGADFGPQVLHVVVAATPTRLGQLEDAPLAALDDDDLRVFEIELEYRAQLAP